MRKDRTNTVDRSRARITLAAGALLLVVFASIAPSFHSEAQEHECAICRLASLPGDQVAAPASAVALPTVAWSVIELDCKRDLLVASKSCPPRGPPQ